MRKRQLNSNPHVLTIEVQNHEAEKATARQGAGGGPNSSDDKPDVAVSPSFSDLHKQMTTDPLMAAKLLGVSPEMVRHAIMIQSNP